jgi:hypothetical protein
MCLVHWTMSSGGAAITRLCCQPSHDSEESHTHSGQLSLFTGRLLETAVLRNSAATQSLYRCPRAQFRMVTQGTQPTLLSPASQSFSIFSRAILIALNMPPTSTYILVDSLYGPGTVIAWLLTMVSVLIDWTLNKSMRHDDTVNFNLIAALILPIISTGHLTYQITRLLASVPQIITSTNFDDRAMVAALEAPLNICETFSWCSLILVLPCMSWRSGLARKSCFWIVTSVGLLSWTTETILYSRTTAKGIKIQDTTLSRPYVFQFTPIIVASWTFIIGCFVVVGGSKAIHILRKCLLPARGSRVRSSETAVPMVSIGAVTGVYMPVSFIVFFYAMAAQGEDFWPTAKHLGVFFFPKITRIARES